MILRGGAGEDTLKGGAGADEIYGYGADDYLQGLDGNDVLVGHDGDDTILGGNGDDYIIGGNGNDYIHGGAGIDWAAYEDAASGVTVDLAITTAQNTGGGGIDVILAVENLYGSAHNDSLSGNTLANILSGGLGDDRLYGRNGADTLNGGDGADWLVGGAGNDAVNGGAGIDTASYEDSTKGVKVDLTLAGAAQNTVGAGFDLLTSIENLAGSDFNDTLRGDAGANLLSGGAGDDILFGGAGDDVLIGGAGNDQFDGGDGFDTVSFADNLEGGVYLDFNTKYFESGAHGADSFTSIEKIIGTGFNDVMFGSFDKVEHFEGGAGDDILKSSGNGDILDGGEGDDSLTSSLGSATIIGGAGEDTYTAAFVYTGATVDLGREGVAQNIGGGNMITLSGVENLHLLLADDTVYFSRAANKVWGGDGADTFIYRNYAEIGKGATADHIMDWHRGSDVIDLSRIDANSKVAGDQAFTWVESFTKQAGQIMDTYDPTTKISHVQMDINGDGVAEAELYLHGYSANIGIWIL